MSEEQVLPPRPKRTETFGGHCYKPHDADAYMDALETALAQSEAERERLQGELVESHELFKATFGLATENANKLARERELHQGLRGRIKGAVEKLEDWNGDAARGFSGSAAVTEAIALLEDKSKPVAHN